MTFYSDKLTLEQALQKGVEAHKAGKAQEADRYYTAILKTQPKHPDANHNMGVLAVGVGKVQEALPFFKTALEANPNIAQFWFSYIDALIKLDRIKDAKAVFEQAKNNGAKGEGFDQIEERLGTSISKNSNPQEPSGELFQSIVNLYTQGQYQEVLTQASRLQKQFPKSFNLYNIIGTANQGLGKLDEAVEAFNKAVSIKPDFAEACYNMGNALQDLGKLDEAIKAYNKAVSIKPNYAKAYNNMGNALKAQGKLDEVIEAYKKVAAIKPDLAEAYNNMGIALKEQGKLDEAVEAFNKAVFIKPGFAEAYNNLGVVYMEAANFKQAQICFEKTLRINPNQNKLGLSLALKGLGKYEEAIETVVWKVNKPRN